MQKLIDAVTDHALEELHYELYELPKLLAEKAVAWLVRHMLHTRTPVYFALHPMAPGEIDRVRRIDENE